MSLETLIQRSQELFEATFDGTPEVISVAPGRVNLIGEHTDYHDGYVFPIAVDRYVVVAARLATSSSRLVSDSFGDSGSFDIEALSGEKWLKYCLGVPLLWAKDGLDVPEIEAVVVTDLPSGAGLSSSAAIETSFALIYRQWLGLGLDKIALAKSCQRSENLVVGVPCGLMDQLASGCGVAGHALFMDLREPVGVEPVPMPADLAVIVCDTGAKHDLGDSCYPARRRQSEEAAAKLGVKVLRDISTAQVLAAGLEHDLERRARHVTSEIERCLEFKQALVRGDLKRLGELMAASHASLRDDYEVSSTELDITQEICLGQPGCIGARMTGGGFGGACVALVNQAIAADFAAKVEAEMKAKGLTSAHVFSVRAADGAHIAGQAN